MSSSGSLYFVIVCLVLIAGVIIGQGFDFKVELKDLLTLGATLGTLWYASNGLKHNRKIYMSSITPLIERFIALDEDKFAYKFSLKNYGTGSAINFKYTVTRGEQELTVKVLQEQILAIGGWIKLEIGSELGISANSSLNILSFSTKKKEVYDSILMQLREYSLELSYSSIQGDEFKKEFSLVP